MLLGPSGQNIYPEEIEEKLNSSDYISEVLAIEENHKIVALIVPDKDVLESEGVKEEQWNSFFSKIIDDVNSSLPNYSQISSFRIQEEEFDKTPKRSIKRFKYQK
jgi:long-chain acyl-CoA synthetase